MSQKMSGIARFGTSCLMVAVWIGLLACSGCEDGENDFSHQPPTGKGTIIVDNHTTHDLDVYIDGTDRGQTGDDSDRAYDLEPGVHRVVINSDDSDGFYADDVDVLEGRLTVLEVSRAGSYGDGLHVSVDIQ